MDRIRHVLVTGGAGYVGAVLVPRLLAQGYGVRVVDLYVFGEDALGEVRGHPRLEEIRGDIRDEILLRDVMPGCDAVIHLACISNDPCFALNPTVGRSINYEAFEPLVRIAKRSGVRRFVYASTSSVYGVSDAPEITEEHALVPITDYSKYKALCEPILLAQHGPGFTPVIVRPATVCGYSPRQRLDLTVNILTTHAVHAGKITVFGGSQKRPNIHIEDMVDVYQLLLTVPAERIAMQVFNAGYQNHSVDQLAEIVRRVVTEEMPDRKDVEIVRAPSDDPRSYHISSRKLQRELGFTPRRSIEDAVRDLVGAFREGRIPEATTDIRYHNVKTMRAIDLTLPGATTSMPVAGSVR